MKNIRFFYNNLFDAATLTLSSEDPDFPGANLQHQHHTLYWLGTSTTVQVTWDFGAAKSIDAFIGKYHNITAGATVTLSCDDNPSFTSPESHVLPVTDPLVYLWDIASPVSYRYFRLDVSGSGSNVYLGRIFSGASWSPVRNFDNLYTRRLVDPSPRQYSIGNQIFSNLQAMYRVYKLDFKYLSAADMAIFQTMFEEYCGLTRPFFVSVDPDNAAENPLYVLFSEDIEVNHVFMDAAYDISIQVKGAQ